MSDNIIPAEHDVLFIDGVATTTHPGSQNYLDLIFLNKGVYKRCSSEEERTKISMAIVASIKENGGRFIHSSPFDGCWAILMEVAAFKKTTEALDKLVNEIKQQEEIPSQQKMPPFERPSARTSIDQQTKAQYPEPFSNSRKRYRSSSSNSSSSRPISFEESEFLAAVANSSTRPSLEKFCLEFLASNENNTERYSQSATLAPPKKISSPCESELGHVVGNSAARSSVEVCEELLGTSDIRLQSQNGSHINEHEPVNFYGRQQV